MALYLGSLLSEFVPGEAQYNHGELSERSLYTVPNTSPPQLVQLVKESQLGDPKAQPLRCGHTSHAACIAEWCSRAGVTKRCLTVASAAGLFVQLVYLHVGR